MVLEHTQEIQRKYRLRPAGGVIAQEAKIPCCLSDNNAAQPATGVANTHYKNGDENTAAEDDVCFQLPSPLIS